MIIKTNDTSISNENRKGAAKHILHKEEHITNDKTVIFIVGNSAVKDVFSWELSDKNEKEFREAFY